ncbi:hypothetical protein EI94DRAFT_1737298 [Lactarius quietus]|nr:hypothetical protein EI94DRAFT_1737298 [Lactarius quietus]
MTSTPRSSLPWRTSRKNRAPTSLSLILATPEVASPRASAVTFLPPLKMSGDADVKAAPLIVEDSERRANTDTEAPPSDNGEPQPVYSSSPTEDTTAPDTNTVNPPEPPEVLTPAPAPTPQPRSWLASLSRRSSSSTPLNELAKQSPPLATGEQAISEPVLAAPPPLAERLDPSPATTPSPVTDPQVPAHAVQPETDIKSSIPSKRPWFAPSSSSKRSSKLRTMNKPEPANDPTPTNSPPAPETPQPPVTNIIPPTPPKPELSKVEGKPPPASESVPIPTSRKWFSPVSSLQSRSPDAETRTTSPLAVTQTGVASPTTPASIDDQVPKLPSAGPQSESVAPSVLVSSDTSQNLSALNPSTSRFALSIPFLGRPKVPLDRAAVSVKDTDVAPRVPEPEDSSSQSPGEVPKTDGDESRVETTDTASPSGPNPESTINAQSSWWGLVGWGPTITQPIFQTQDAPSIGPPNQEQANEVAMIADSPPRGTTTDVLDTPSVQAQPEAPETNENSGAGWLSPWSWYGSHNQPSPAPNPAPIPAQTMDVIDGEAQAQHPGSADADIKEARATVTTAQMEPANPIQSSIATNVSGWASFFSSKTLLAKRITDIEYREEGAMEVMEIDDGDEERAGTAMLVATSEARPGNDAARETQASKMGPASPRSPSPSPKPNVKPEKKPEELKGSKRVSVSPAPSKGSGRASPRVPAPPNLVLPTWEDTFLSPPRSTALQPETSSAFTKTVRFVSGMLFARDDGTSSTGKGKAPSRGDDRSFADFGRDLPRSWDVIGERLDGDILRGCRRVVVIGIHGWFPGAITRTVLGEPTGTSSKFVTMMCRALEAFQEQHQVQFEKVTQIPLEGEGTINKRVEKLYTNLLANHEWIDDLHAADAILVATHSQGSIVSTHLLDRLIHDKHIKTSRTASDLLASASAALHPGGTSHAAPKVQRVCCLALCGIHLGPLRYLSSSSLVLPYIQYFESAAAKELFEFQTTTSEVSKSYVKALRNVFDHGVKMVYIASLNDQVVPLYSGLFTAASHPLILRALYIDGDVYHSSDFLSNLLVLLLRVMNVGLSDSGLLTHLSEATAGSLSGIGHSSAYEELATYSLAVKYLFMTNEGSTSNSKHPELVLQPFDAKVERNDYEIPWALRDLIANERVAHLFAVDFAHLRNAFPDWQPKTAILRDIKRKLQPIQRLNTNHLSTESGGPSKL